MARNKLHPIPHPPRTPVLGNMLTVDGGAPILFTIEGALVLRSI